MNWTCGIVVMLYLTVRKGRILNFSIPMLCSEHTVLPKGGWSWKPSQCFSWTRRIVRRAFKECDFSVLRGRTSSNEEGKFGRERESRIGCLCSRSWSRRLGAVKPFPRTAAVLMLVSHVATCLGWRWWWWIRSLWRRTGTYLVRSRGKWASRTSRSALPRTEMDHLSFPQVSSIVIS